MHADVCLENEIGMESSLKVCYMARGVTLEPEDQGLNQMYGFSLIS